MQEKSGNLIDGLVTGILWIYVAYHLVKWEWTMPRWPREAIAESLENSVTRTSLSGTHSFWIIIDEDRIIIRQPKGMLSIIIREFDFTMDIIRQPNNITVKLANQTAASPFSITIREFDFILERRLFWFCFIFVFG